MTRRVPGTPTESAGRGHGWGSVLPVGLVVISLAGAFVSQVVALDSLRAPRERRLARSDLERCMEGLLASPPTTLEEGLFAPGRPIEAFTGGHLVGERILARYPGWRAGRAPEPLEVELTVTWSDWRGHERSETLAWPARRDVAVRGRPAASP